MPSMNGFHVLSIGVHWIQAKSALSPIATFMEIRMNQRTTLIHRSVNRNRVSAKLDLAQMVATMLRVPAAFMVGINLA